MQIIRPNTNFPFIKHANAFMIASTIMVIFCFILPFVLRPNWGTNFDGGSSILLRFEKPVSSEEVRAAFVAMGFQDASVQTYGSSETGSRYLIRTKAVGSLSCDDGAFDAAIKNLPAKLTELGLQDVRAVHAPLCKDIRDVFALSVEADPAKNPTLANDPSPRDPRSGVTVGQLSSALSALGIDAAVTYQDRSTQSQFQVRPRQLEATIVKGLHARMNKDETNPANFTFNPDIGVAEIVTVGPDVGEKFRNDGIISLVFAVGLILIYIAIRFDVRFAPGAIIALIHDVVTTFGLLTLLQIEISLETVAALLAILGYSINDTIVTFDRIRENLSLGSQEPIETLVNRSVNECLSRTLLTSGTTLLAIISLAILGSGVVADFAITLIIGIIFGTYSSIFIASPLVLTMNRIFNRNKTQKPPTLPEEANAPSPG